MAEHHSFATGGHGRNEYFGRPGILNNMLEGRMSVAVKISSTGHVCSANIVKNEVGDPGLTSCVLQMFRSGTFPQPKGGCVDAQVPLNFKKRD